MNNKIYLELNRIFQDIFDDDTINVESSTTASDIEEWDSLEHINLIVAIEATFKIKFDISEVSSMKNVGNMVEIITQKLNIK